MSKQPWELDGAEALEIIHGLPPLPVAWTVDDDVYVRVGDTTEREDVFVLIGRLNWEDTPDDPADDSGHNIDRLRYFVSMWRKEEGK